MTPALAMRRAPRDSVRLTMAGSSSGASPTASATANSSESATGRSDATFAAKIASTSSVINWVSIWPKRRRLRSNSVSGARRASRAAISPNSVRGPVAVISTFAVPLRTLVPRQT